MSTCRPKPLLHKLKHASVDNSKPKRQPGGQHTAQALMQFVTSMDLGRGERPDQPAQAMHSAAAMNGRGDQTDVGEFEGGLSRPTKPRANACTPDIIESIMDQFSAERQHSRRILHNPQNVKEFLAELQKPDTNVNKFNHQGNTPLHSLVKRKFKPKVEQLKFDLLITILVYSDVEINLPSGCGNTALHMAVEGGDMKTIKLLLSFGANINALNSQNKTPLDLIQGPYRLFHRQESVARIPEISAVLEDEPKDVFQDRRPTSPVQQGPMRPMLVRRSSLITPTFSGVQDIIKFLQDHGAVRGREIADSYSLVANRSPVKMFADLSQREKDMSTENGVSLLSPLQVKKSSQHMLGDDWTAQIPSLCFQLSKAIETRLIDITLSLRQNPNDAVALAIQLKELRMVKEAGSRILFLDGGGLRGLIETEILSQLEERTGRSITELFDWIVGTSTGGILALGLVYAKKTVKEMRQMYHRLKEEVIGKPHLGMVYDSEGFEAMLKDEFGHMRMDEVKHPRVLVTAVDKSTVNLKLHFFNNCFDDDFSSEEVWKVARYTSAAPTSFSEMDNYVDGGVLANNPGSIGLTRIQDFYRNQQKRLPISLVVSVGTGRVPDKELGRSDFQSLLHFGKHWFNTKDTLTDRVGNLTTLLNQAMTNSEQVAENLRSRCLEQGISYYRLNPQLKTKIGMGETDNDKLIDMILLCKTTVTNQPHFSSLVLRFHQCSQANQRMTIRRKSKRFQRN